MRSIQIVVEAAIVSVAKISRVPVKLLTSKAVEVLMCYPVESSALLDLLRRVKPAASPACQLWPAS